MPPLIYASNCDLVLVKSGSYFAPDPSGAKLRFLLHLNMPYASVVSDSKISSDFLFDMRRAMSEAFGLGIPGRDNDPVPKSSVYVHDVALSSAWPSGTKSAGAKRDGVLVVAEERLDAIRQSHIPQQCIPYVRRAC